jgi:hypothetical protein
MSANSLATVIRNLSKQLAEGVRDGNALINEARDVVSLVREARGWLLTVENELDPEQPAPRSTDGG